MRRIGYEDPAVVELPVTVEVARVSEREDASYVVVGTCGHEIPVTAWELREGRGGWGEPTRVRCPYCTQARLRCAGEIELGVLGLSPAEVARRVVYSRRREWARGLGSVVVIDAERLVRILEHEIELMLQSERSRR